MKVRARQKELSKTLCGARQRSLLARIQICFLLIFRTVASASSDQLDFEFKQQNYTRNGVHLLEIPLTADRHRSVV